ncbi:MAG: valine--tRNA ligase [Nanoarchaeota archaeon]
MEKDKKEEYSFKEAEEQIRQFWEREKIFKFNPNSRKEIYSIDTPPPYASSGHLHVGHALHYTQFEIMARVMRLLGKEVYFAPGFDDNGLPTEKYVEEKLGINKTKTNRAKFRELCLKESEKVEKDYAENVFKKLGHSYDWDLLYTTISKEAQKVAQTSFLRLVRTGDCYRAKEPVIWCPCHETALAQAEVEDLERETKLNYVDFDYGKEKITIATTRPELLSSCVGIFVNPNDMRYKKLIGKKLRVPIFNYEVKVMADEKVDKDFGTGVVMICTFGDNTDIEWWKKYKLDLKLSLDEKGKLNENAGKFQGLGIKEAKEKILEQLEKEGRLKKQETLKQTVGSCWRCSTPVEYIVKHQWFIKTLKYKKELIRRAREINWHPDFMRTRFENWTENLGWDWIISRQRYYGIPIPVWYCECGEIILPEEKELPLDPLETSKTCPKCKKKANPDIDVFDTWMTSSNSPEVACRWLKNPKLYDKLAPMSLRPQSHDIIRTWAFYTILKSHLLFNRIPWKDVMIGTYILDSHGKGMHKSKGNAIWADELIERYSVDAFRYWVGSAYVGSDLPFNEKELIAGKKFLTKIWNASKFVFMHLADYKPRNVIKMEQMDLYMLVKLRGIINKTREFYENYDIASARKEAESFFWHDFCDNYLEIVKNRVYNGSKEEKESAFYTLYHSLLAVLKLMAPITPFITEALYQKYYRENEKEKSIHIAGWPELDFKENKKIREEGDLFVEVLSRVRMAKSKAQKSMKAEIILAVEKKDKLKNMLEDLKSVVNAREIKEGKFKVEFV